MLERTKKIERREREPERRDSTSTADRPQREGDKLCEMPPSGFTASAAAARSPAAAPARQADGLQDGGGARVGNDRQGLRGRPHRDRAGRSPSRSSSPPQSGSEMRERFAREAILLAGVASKHVGNIVGLRLRARPAVPRPRAAPRRDARREAPSRRPRAARRSPFAGSSSSSSASATATTSRSSTATSSRRTSSSTRTASTRR